jgi:hypothetical protein
MRGKCEELALKSRASSLAWQCGSCHVDACRAGSFAVAEPIKASRPLAPKRFEMLVCGPSLAVDFWALRQSPPGSKR